jgi:hypothetical protein
MEVVSGAFLYLAWSIYSHPDGDLLCFSPAELLAYFYLLDYSNPISCIFTLVPQEINSFST